MPYRAQFQRKPRYVVFEQQTDIGCRINDIFGPFFSWEKANQLCKKLQTEHPKHWYGIRQLMHGNTWLKGA